MKKNYYKLVIEHGLRLPYGLDRDDIKHIQEISETSYVKYFFHRLFRTKFYRLNEYYYNSFHWDGSNGRNGARKFLKELDEMLFSDSESNKE